MQRQQCSRMQCRVVYRVAVQMASDTAEKHTLELQKLSLERAKLIVSVRTQRPRQRLF